MTFSIAFLGLGIMGAAMAQRLIDAGYALRVYNRNRSRSSTFKRHARIADSPREAADGAQIVISMVTDDDASRAVWMGPAGALVHLRPGTICLETSTLSPDWIREWAKAVTAAGGIPVDAPVTGTKSHAEAGQLVFVLGGDPDAIDALRPALTAMSRKIVHLGPTGSGSVFKLINNFMGGVQLATLAEAFAMIDRAGLDTELAIETLLDGSPGSPMVKMVSARVMADDYRPNFQVALQAKDMVYALQTAESLNVNLPTVKAALTTIQSVVGEGHGAEDIATVVRTARAQVAN
ncbi:NAD(P)-dependent oxidoreductase [Asticcacaulis excentricus]|uniref:3-hydroxyisobutyrate dehydrogenase n=1 Tax=Asticcacaulis excentricus (strain ATCC 15261 / DSM 4724 / KCTC 12464 / NCIMB 9791 / VKM B-1370 / CB 48) TaxID=573065 RepID=E8RUR4_ASTEC|nr:NAD(P)-dependent oxidoreductase [Asticcacaulis excentricus]ADU14114.1 3-hydroxyisobutyrate dehydrogenase [Asticcacaulis excentricus CB 48]